MTRKLNFKTKISNFTSLLVFFASCEQKFYILYGDLFFEKIPYKSKPSQNSKKKSEFVYRGSLRIRPFENPLFFKACCLDFKIIINNYCIVSLYGNMGLQTGFGQVPDHGQLPITPLPQVELTFSKAYRTRKTGF
jgi:hypothetical protein